MLFASDLDRTLIYSTRFADPNAHPLKSIETKDEAPINYIYEVVLDKLKKLAQKLHFIPVTTRTIQQYQRITLFHQEIVPPYAIVSNGGNILVHGQLDRQWNRHIKKRIDQEALPFAEIWQEFGRLTSPQWLLAQRTADDLFYYFIVQETLVPTAALEELRPWLTASGWSLSMQGRKIYLVPSCLSKWNAVLYIKEKLGLDCKIAAAGDSLLDLCMLEKADYSYLPAHGEAVKALPQNHHKEQQILLTKHQGHLAAAEILDEITALLEA